MTPRKYSIAVEDMMSTKQLYKEPKRFHNFSDSY